MNKEEAIKILSTKPDYPTEYDSFLFDLKNSRWMAYSVTDKGTEWYRYNGDVYVLFNRLGCLPENISYETLLAISKEETKPVYTQAMLNISVVPAVGADFIVGDTSNASRIRDFENKIVTVLATTYYKKGTVITFYNSSFGIGCAYFSPEWVKPIDTKTDREKLKDDIFKFKLKFYDTMEFYDSLVDAIISGKFHKTTFSGDK